MICAVFAVAFLHDLNRLGGGKDMFVSCAGVIGVTVGDNGALNRLHRVDIAFDWVDVQIVIKPVHK